MKNIIFIYVLSFTLSCNIDKWDLDDKSNETIPNYSITLQGTECNGSFKTNIYPIDKDNFVTVVQKANNFIRILKIIQKLNGDQWMVDIQELSALDGRTLHGFQKAGNFYYVLTSENENYKIIKLDKEFKVTDTYSLFTSFIDTSYNKIESVSFQGFSADTTAGIYLYGQLTSFAKKYSCVMKMDLNLKPAYLKTYFENNTIIGLLPIDKDQFVAIDQNVAEMSLIQDNTSGQAYKKYDITFNELFHSGQLLQVDNKLYLTGTIQSGTGKAVEISLNNKTAFISDVKNYQVNDLIAISSSRQTLLMCGVSNLNNENTSFLTEYKENSYLWCNSYNDKSYHKSLAITEANNLGLVYLFLIKENNRYFLHLVRTDEEGATLENPYDLNCVQ